MKPNEASDQKDSQTELITTPIAIIGMASLFPQARTLSEYWDNILNKIDAIVDVPPSRWTIDDYYDPDPKAPDKSYCKRGAFIPDVEFDPAEFGLPPNLLEITDVSQLLSLVVAKECLEDGGYGDAPKALLEKTGVILGMVGIGSKLVIQLMARLQYPVWEKVLRSYGISAEDSQQIIDKIKLAYPKWEENSFPGSIGNVVAGRIANRFDLGGTNCVVDAACGSSLAAIRMAVSELIEGRADLMITGGLDTDNSISTYMSFSKTPAFSKSENVRPFDEDSDGMMIGEGIGMVLLKRLADARRDGDRVYAVIKSIGTSSDGRFKSIYAPSSAGQALALRRAYSEAGFSPATAGLIEAHGTGTLAGDPAEFQGLNEVFSKDNPRKQYIALGSVKSQIGHTKAAAGVASLIKASLALHNKVLPPTIHIKKPNPKLEIEATPFYLNTESRPWIQSDAYPRRARVSSFGFGGTNFHLTLEENEKEQTRAYRLQTTTQVILVSAPTLAELQKKCEAWSERLATPGGPAEFSALVRETRTTDIHQDDPRVGFVALNGDEAHRKLIAAMDLLQNNKETDYAVAPLGVYYGRRSLEPKGKVVALFPGQGSQYVNMGRELAINFPPIRQTLADMDWDVDGDHTSPISSFVYPIPVFDSTAVDRQKERLTCTEHAQPAIGAFSLGLYKLFKQAGFEADFTAGHSFGELTALCAAGVVDEDAFYLLARARGKAMAPPAADPDFDAGAMLAVKGDIHRLTGELQAYPEITLANWNSNNQVVLAGSKPAISVVQKALAEKGYTTVILPVSAAFHTSLVAHAERPFAEVIQRVKINPPAIEVYSNTTGERYSSDPDRIRQTLTNHILNPVLFKNEIEAIYARGGSIFIEFGPKDVLTNLVKNILEGKPHVAIALNANPKKDSDVQLREAVAHLCVLGLDLRGFDPYALPENTAPERKKSSASLMLNGGLYLTEKTRSAFQAAITEKNSLTPPQREPNLASAAPVSTPAQESGAGNLAVLLDQFQSFQSDTLKVHSQFLTNDGEYGRNFTQLLQQELDLLSGNPSEPMLEQLNQALQTLERSLSQFQQHQAETLRIHDQYLQNQAEFANRLLQTLQNQGSVQPARPRSFPIPVNPPIPAAQTLPANNNGHAPSVQSLPANNGHTPGTQTLPSNNNGQNQVARPVTPPEKVTRHEIPTSQPVQSQTLPPRNIEDLDNALMNLVSEKTGYPTEMLDLGMDMEADLGIDSIKRVEIMGAIQTLFPDLPKIDTTALAEMRTLGDVAKYMTAIHPPEAAPDQALNPSLEPPEIKEQAETRPVAPMKFSIEEVTQAMLAIVSEKTGYPTEMLDLGMDMEADLGIDSIKRVEIMGAMQTRFPELPKSDATALAEMRTLGQIVDSMTAANQQTSPVDKFYEKELQTATAQTSEIRVDLPRGVVALKRIPEPDNLEKAVAEGYICLLMDDGTDLTLALADRLTAEGKKVVVLRLPENLVDQRKMPQTIPSVQLTDWSEAGIRKTLETLQEEHGLTAVFIHLDPVGPTSGSHSETEQTIVKIIFLIAKLLKETLNSAAQAGYAGFITVTHLDGKIGLASSGTVEPLSGALFGLVKTLNLEWDKVFCRGIDLEPEMDAQRAAGLILAEMHDPNRLINEISYHSGERFTLVVEPVTEEA